jgi:hypothetical protein
VSASDVWKRIDEATRYVLTGNAERIDGEGWKVYRAGTIIRIDLSPDFNPDKP